jgi:imidazolonepropionase-like amidohydrolase
MKRWLWLALKILGGIVAALVALIVALIVILRPAKPLAVPRQGVTLSGVTVVNPGLDRRPNQTVVVEGGTIKSISADASAAADARYANAYVLPGLIDMHVHNPPPQTGDLNYFFLMYLRYGVTAIRDTGNAGFMFATRGKLLSGDVAGPRAFTSGPILDGDPPVWPFSIIVRSPAEADRAVDSLAGQGADFVKVYEKLTPDALHEIEAEAHRKKLPVVGHVPELVRFEDAHIDDVQHLTATASRPPRLYSLRELNLADAKGWHDLDDARIAFVIKTSLDQHITHTPTLIVLDRIFRGDDYDAQFNEPTAQLMPLWYREFWRRPDLGYTPQEAESLRNWGSELPKMKLMVRRMHEAGVPLHVGTDTINPFVVPGAAMHEEMRNFLDCGFTPEQVWVASTRDNGASLPLKDLGVLKDGAPADFLIFKEDPTGDLSKLDTLEAVVANGRLYPREDLDAALARYRDRYARRSVQWAMMTLMRLMAPHPEAKPAKPE